VTWYYIAKLKSTREPIPSLGYFVIKHQGSTSFLEGYCSCPKLLNTPTIPQTRYLENTLGSMTYLLKLGGVLHSPTLPSLGYTIKTMG